MGGIPAVTPLTKSAALEAADELGVDAGELLDCRRCAFTTVLLPLSSAELFLLMSYAKFWLLLSSVSAHAASFKPS